MWVGTKGSLVRAAMAASVSIGMVACGGVLRSSLPLDAPYALIRYGPERTALNYHDRFQAEKQQLLTRMNRVRAAEGVAPLRYEPRAALVGDRYCLEMALSGSTGHWDPRGRSPYLRWGLAGGIDYHVQNVVALSGDEIGAGASMSAQLGAALDEILAGDPGDTRRRVMMDPTLTHVGIGAASVGGQFRMSQEFTRVMFEWLEVPDRPLPLGGVAVLVGRPLPGWRISEVEVRWERPLSGTAPASVHRQGGYGYPELVRRLLPAPPPGVDTRSDRPADFTVSRDGRFSISFPLDQGPGFYFVIALLAPVPIRYDSPTLQATSAMVVAVP